MSHPDEYDPHLDLAPPQTMPMVIAIHRIGRIVYGDRWTGDETDAKPEPWDSAREMPKGGISSNPTKLREAQQAIRARLDLDRRKEKFENENAEHGAHERYLRAAIAMCRFLHLNPSHAIRRTTQGFEGSPRAEHWIGNDALPSLLTSGLYVRQNAIESVADDLLDAERAKSRDRGGRPTEYDWPGCSAAMQEIAKQDGPPKTQAELKRRMTYWFEENPPAPARTTIRDKARTIFREMKRSET